MRKILLAGVAALAVSYAPAADAALSIYTTTIVNNVPGALVLQASNAANTSAGVNNISVGGFTIGSMSVFGVDGSGALMETALNVTTSGTNPNELLVVFVQTDLSLGNGPFDFTTLFTGSLNDTLTTRRTAVSTTNTPLSSSNRPTIGLTTVGFETDMTSVTLSGLFSVLEFVRFKADGPEPSLRMSDAIDVPEPMSMALLGAGLLGLGVVRRRRG